MPLPRSHSTDSGSHASRRTRCPNSPAPSSTSKSLVSPLSTLPLAARQVASSSGPCAPQKHRFSAREFDLIWQTEADVGGLPSSALRSRSDHTSDQIRSDHTPEPCSAFACFYTYAFDSLHSAFSPSLHYCVDAVYPLQPDPVSACPCLRCLCACSASLDSVCSTRRLRHAASGPRHQKWSGSIPIDASKPNLI